MNRIYIVSLLFIALISHRKLYAQAVEPSFTVSKGIFQIEMEGQFATEKENKMEVTSWLVPNTLFRYGISDNVELQFNIPVLGERLEYENQNIHVLHRIDDLQIGTAINLWKENNLLPEAALMIRVLLPSEDISFKKIGEIVALNFSNTLSNKWILNYNLGYIHEVNQTHSGYYIVNLYYEPNDRWHFYLENTGEFKQNERVYQLANTGFGINITQNFTADFSIGKGINENTFYTGLILTWAIKTRKP